MGSLYVPAKFSWYNKNTELDVYSVPEADIDNILSASTCGEQITALLP
ncbi:MULTISPECIES: hypothetical protein [Providencia]|nr:hypothetical protein [Providencia stuartii]EJD6408582.1 hypothetical protein [Providencia rettgeri]ELR5074549.1 hypothetical protein [Providencia stuartii]UQZ13343.1 hypothetical protein M8G38_07210 [Providencia stuartii]HEP0305004.1 hypothetical protein [Providencia rettgeri]